MPTDEASVGPPERVRIVTPPTAPGAEGEELPFRMAVIGDFTGAEDETPMAERKLRNVDNKNFDDIMGSMNLNTSFSVRNALSGAPGEEIPVDLKFNSIKSFRPEEVAKQVPQVNDLVEFRKKLVELRSRIVREPKLAKDLNAAISDALSKVGKG